MKIPIVKKLFGGALVILGVIFVGYGIFRWFGQLQYQASVTLLISKSGRITDGMEGKSESSYLQDCVEQFQSTEIMDEAAIIIYRYQLENHFSVVLSPLEIEMRLPKQAQFQAVTRDSTVKITCIGSSPEDAARLANAMSNAFINYQAKQFRRVLRQFIGSFEEDLKSENNLIETRQQALAQLRHQLNVPDPEPDRSVLQTKFHNYLLAQDILKTQLAGVELEKEKNHRLKAELASLAFMMADLKTQFKLKDVAPPADSIDPGHRVAKTLFVGGILSVILGYGLLLSTTMKTKSILPVLFLVATLLASGCASHQSIHPVSASVFSGPGVYIVQRGDTATLIAHRLCLGMDRLYEYNPKVNFTRLRVGQRLNFTSIDFASSDNSLFTTVSIILSQCETIKPGMTRVDLDKLFKFDGGVQVTNPQRFALRCCDCVKVEIEFKLADPKSKEFKGNPADVIKSISKPYLEYMNLD